MIIELDEAKNYLRVDFTDDDTLIQTLIDAAEAHLTKATGTVFDSTYPLAKTICLMLVASWYSNRENAQQLSIGNTTLLNGLIAQLSASETISPPQVPVGLNGTAEVAQAWLRWRANIDPDVDGYNVYRDGVKVNTELVREHTHREVWPGFSDWPYFGNELESGHRKRPGVVGYRDRNVVSGQTYSYQVTAVDTLGNESAKSSAVSVTPL